MWLLKESDQETRKFSRIEALATFKNSEIKSGLEMTSTRLDLMELITASIDFSSVSIKE